MKMPDEGTRGPHSIEWGFLDQEETVGLVEHVMIDVIKALKATNERLSGI